MEDSTVPQRFTRKYKEVRNVIVDEAQNFKDRDGDWYSLAQKLANQGSEKLANQGAEDAVLTNQGCVSETPTDPQDSGSEIALGQGADWETLTPQGVGAESLTSEEVPHGSPNEAPEMSGDGDKSLTQNHPTGPLSPPTRARAAGAAELVRGYFWVFMDYAQKVHKFKAGLPGLIGKNNFMLSEISRNSKEIFDYAMRFMDKPSEAVPPGELCLSDAPILGHGYHNGKGVEVMRCAKDSVHRTLFSVLELYLGSGMTGDDIAILVSKRGEKEAVEKSVEQEFTRKGQCRVKVSVVQRSVLCEGQ